MEDLRPSGTGGLGAPAGRNSEAPTLDTSLRGTHGLSRARGFGAPVLSTAPSGTLGTGADYLSAAGVADPCSRHHVTGSDVATRAATDDPADDPRAHPCRRHRLCPGPSGELDVLVPTGGDASRPRDQHARLRAPRHGRRARPSAHAAAGGPSWPLAPSRRSPNGSSSGRSRSWRASTAGASIPVAFDPVRARLAGRGPLPAAEAGPGRAEDGPRQGDALTGRMARPARRLSRSGGAPMAAGRLRRDRRGTPMTAADPTWRIPT